MGGGCFLEMSSAKGSFNQKWSIREDPSIIFHSTIVSLMIMSRASKPEKKHEQGKPSAFKPKPHILALTKLNLE